MEVLNSHLRKSSKEEGSFSFWDGLMKKNWPNLINPPLVYSKSNKEARANCRWEYPPFGWCKLNFDGATKGNLGTTGIGCIINDDSSKWLAKLAMPIPLTSNNMEEQGLQLCINLGLSKVIIEGDSQIILNVVRK